MTKAWADVAWLIGQATGAWVLYLWGPYVFLLSLFVCTMLVVYDHRRRSECGTR